MTFTHRDFLRIVLFCKVPILWVVGCLVGLIYAGPHAFGPVLTPEDQAWHMLFLAFLAALVGFFVGLFCITEALHRIDMDERLRAYMGRDEAEENSPSIRRAAA